MENIPLFRHELIKSLTTRSREGGGDSIVAIWKPLTTQVIWIVGEPGFNSLYDRSIFITQQNCPWYVFPSQSPQTAERLKELKMNSESLSRAQYHEVNSMLLINFTDILASLIGEHLTLRILHSAWDSHTWNIVDRESGNE